MPSPRYEDHEGDFLNYMITHCGFSSKIALVFEKRFLQEHDSYSHKQLKDIYHKKLIEGTKSKKSDDIFRQTIEAICNKLEEKGCPSIQGNGRWQNCRKWLREVAFPQWAKEQGLVVDRPLTLDQLWNQLKAKATPTNKMGPILIPAIPTLEMWDFLSEHPKTVPLGSHIHFHIELEKTGHLILLEKGTSGRLWCLCPSFFAPQSYLNTGKVVLPQANSRQKYFKVSGVPGTEEIVAIIAPTSPPFPWLPKPDQNPLQLQEPHLQELLGYFEGSPDSSILYMDYAVTSS